MGGQKTFGVIFNEALDLLKKHYWQLFGAGSVVAVAALVAMTVLVCVWMVFYLLSMLVVPMNMLFLWTYVDYPGDYSQSTGMASAAFVIVLVVFTLIMTAVMMIASLGSGILIQTAGASATDGSLRLIGNGTLTMPELWGSFKRNWKRYLGISAWSSLWVFLWSLLLYIPGFYKAVSYMLAPPLVIQYPDMRVRDALKKSMEITDGYKGRLFLIFLTTFAFTLGAELLSFCFPPVIIAALLFWIYPMQFAMLAIAYLDIRRAAIEKGLLPPDPVPPAEEQKY